MGLREDDAGAGQRSGSRLALRERRWGCETRSSRGAGAAGAGRSHLPIGTEGRAFLPDLVTSFSSGPCWMADDADSVEHRLPICKNLLGTPRQDAKGAFLVGKCLGMIEATALVQQEALSGGLPFIICIPDNSVSVNRFL